MSLEDYCKLNIWEPLGLKDLTFRISSKADLLDRLVSMVSRQRDGLLVPAVHKPRDTNANVLSGGSGLYGSGVDYVRVLAEVINDGGVLLRSETVKEMFRPQLPNPKYVQEYFDTSAKGTTSLPPSWDSPTSVQYGLSFLMNMNRTQLGRAPGSAQWSGMANTYWVS